MLRNYLMPGFALRPAGRFCGTASDTVGGAGIRQECWWETVPPLASPAQAAPNSAQSKEPPLSGSEQLFSPSDVCAVAMHQMHEKLGEFGLNPELVLPAPEKSPPPRP